MRKEWVERVGKVGREEREKKGREKERYLLSLWW